MARMAVLLGLKFSTQSNVLAMPLFSSRSFLKMWVWDTHRASVHSAERRAALTYPVKRTSMRCPSCKSENRDGAKYCGECGAALPVHRLSG
ncbi:MAG: zinc ribbon domain-containing protein [Thermodesulfobacteriota bacterium]